jgi:hypothetical protein
MNLWEHDLMWEDPIVAEVHAAREKLAAKFNFDPGAFFADVRRRQVSLGSRLVRQKRSDTSIGFDGAPSDGATDPASSEAIPAA